MVSGHAISIVLGCLSPTGLFSDRLRITSRSESSCRETVFSGGRSPSSWPSCWRRPGPQRNGRPGGSVFSRSSGSPGSNWRRACRSITRRRSFGGGMPTMRMRPGIRRRRLYRGIRRIYRRRGRHHLVDPAGARGEERRDLWFGALGLQRGNPQRRIARARTVSSSAAMPGTICAMTDRNTFYALHRQDRVKASAWWSRRC